MKRISNLCAKLVLTGLLAVAFSSAANADTVSWTEWTSAGAGVVDGTMSVGMTSIGVTYSGPYDFAQLNGAGTNYWTNPTIYTGGPVSNPPPNPDIIALGTGGLKTITFSQAVENPIIALVSWNGNDVDFGTPITILNFGAGYWGSGTPVLHGDGNGFFGSGEVHGIIELIGTFNSISFTDTSEGWHGFTVGVTGAAGTVPEPSSLALLGLGGMGLAFGAYRRRRIASAA